MRVLGLAGAVLIGLGCIATTVVADEPPTVDEVAEVQPPLELYIALMADLRSTVRAGGGSCDKLAAGLEVWIDQHADHMSSLVAALEENPPELGELEKHELREDIVAVIDVLTRVTLECAEHEDASKALERLRGVTKDWE